MQEGGKEGSRETSCNEPEWTAGHGGARGGDWRKSAHRWSSKTAPTAPFHDASCNGRASRQHAFDWCRIDKWKFGHAYTTMHITVVQASGDGKTLSADVSDTEMVSV